MSQFSQTILNIQHYYGNVSAEIFLSTRMKNCHLIHASIGYFLYQDHESLRLASHYFNSFFIVSLKSYFFEYLFVYLIFSDLLRISLFISDTSKAQRCCVTVRSTAINSKARGCHGDINKVGKRWRYTRTITSEYLILSFFMNAQNILI